VQLSTLGAGLLAAAVVAGLARRLGWLRTDGAVAAVAVGGAAFGGARWAGGLTLLAFFLTSSLLGHLPAPGRRPPPERTHPARTARQVLANGGPAAAAALAWGWGVGPWALAALAGSLAAAAADTWATEIGTRFGGPPRALGLGPPVVPGTSGGMTAAGTLAGLGGALAVAAVAGLAGIPDPWAVAAAGLGGMLADSALGATLQAVWRCPVCGRRAEVAADGCGVRGRRVRGLPWLDNDGVNLAATLTGGLLAAALHGALGP
jgi:uncharacterized protein (TIGR00297 family)